ncbi:MAG TPA: hypothetical protein VL501_04305 [Pyrinomonadaceae bacterium]|nr:hypothetical protein [Pyrinomonadaceae bacterium]
MKTKYTLLLLTLVTGQLLSMGCFGQSSGGGGRLTGSWDAIVSITNCSTGAIITTFPSTAAFSQGGTYVGITGGASPAERTAEIGVWRHIGDNRYQFKFKTYHSPSGGPATFFDIVTHEITLDADNLTYTSAGTATRYNMAGVQIFSGCSTSVGRRMTLD